MSTLSLEQRFGYLVRDVSSVWRAAIDRQLEPLGLSASRWEPLVVLHRAQAPVTQTMLAAALNIEAPSVVRLLDRLARDGWIRRRACPQDRRAYHVVLTAKAQTACTQIETVLAATRRDIAGALTAEELRLCIDALERVQARAQRLLDGQAAPAAATRAPARR